MCELVCGGGGGGGGKFHKDRTFPDNREDFDLC